MKKSELEEGKVYVAKSEITNKIQYILKWHLYGDKCEYVNLRDKYYYVATTFGEMEYQPATPEQIKHLNACIEANKFIPFDEIPKETNLERAKREYPNGTKFKSAYNPIIEYVVNGEIFIAADGDICCPEGTLFRNGKWAEIISTPGSDGKCTNQFCGKDDFGNCSCQPEQIQSEIQSAIELLKSNGYKVLEKVEEWKEI